MKVWMTGAGGWIGRALQRELAALELRPLPHNPTAPLCWDRPSWDRGDILVHLGWYVAAGDYLHSPENERCFQSSHVLIEAALAAGLRVVGVGSCLEYGRGGGPYRETDPLAPHALYSLRKAALAELFRDEPAFTWARPFHLFGAGEQ
ncbi:MAG TPA: NAD-dependent epimerase/dehydratase family protein, partial [Myxococcota bacterium]|nr:NAD-dependent epimerase/dehydratase family protein [Myxococcota bacterium]